MVSLSKIICVSSLLCFIDVHVILSVKDPNIIMLSWNDKKSNMVSELTWEEDIVQLQKLGILTFWVSLHNP